MPGRPARSVAVLFRRLFIRQGTGGNDRRGAYAGSRFDEFLIPNRRRFEHASATVKLFGERLGVGSRVCVIFAALVVLPGYARIARYVGGVVILLGDRGKRRSAHQCRGRQRL